MRKSLAYRVRDANCRIKDGVNTNIKVEILKNLDTARRLKMGIDNILASEAEPKGAEAMVYEFEKMAVHFALLQNGIFRLKAAIDARKAFIPIAAAVDSELSKDCPGVDELCDSAHFLMEHFHVMGDESTVGSLEELIRRLSSDQPVA